MVPCVRLDAQACVVLPLWDGDYNEPTNFVASLPGFTADAVRTWARYLGVDLGVRASGTQWSTMCPKLARRALDIRYAGASPPTRVALHNAHVTGMIRYRATFAPPSQALLRAHAHRAQIVLSAAWRAIPHDVLLSLRALGFAASLADAEKVCMAALLHHTVTSDAAHRAWGEYDRAIASDDVARLQQPTAGPSRCPGIDITGAVASCAQCISAITSRCSCTRSSASTRSILCFVPHAMYCTMEHFSPCENALYVGIPPYLKLSSALTFTSPPCILRLRSFWHASVAFAMPGALPPALAMRRIACPLWMWRPGLLDAQAYLFSCPVFRHWVDLHLYSTARAPPPPP